MPTHNQTVGNTGEQIACNHLVSLGYNIIDTNVRISRDEVDIIAYDPQDNVYCFTEVKTRSAVNEYDPALNITTRKKKNMRRAAQAWSDKQAEQIGYRLDVILVAGELVTDHWLDIGLTETDQESTTMETQ
jgi:putative endonuclease